MGESEKVATPVLAAGGILVREAPRPLIAVVRLRKEKAWVLPKGKLKPGENALAAAKREVQEETGHDVTVHEFLGSMSHAANRRHKVVQFWRMTPVGGPAHALTSDVKAVKWLPLEQAIRKITSLPAQREHLIHRGLIKEGFFADITVFDAATIADKATYTQPAQLSEGVKYVLVNGQLEFENGHLTGAQAGKPLVNGKSWNLLASRSTFR